MNTVAAPTSIIGATVTNNWLPVMLGTAAPDEEVGFGVPVELPPTEAPLLLPVGLPLEPGVLDALVPGAPGVPVGAPNNCAEENVWQLEDEGRTGVYGGVGTTPSGGWNHVVVAPLVVYTPGGVMSSESQTLKVPLIAL